MHITKADYLGYCFGVRRAIETVEKELEKHKNLFCLGEIIHNKDVVKKLEAKGLDIIESIPSHIDGKVVIRSHGVGKNIILQLQDRNIDFLDLTCPKVKKIHNIVEKASKDGHKIIVIGDSKHPEVKGITGWSSTKTYIIENLKDFNNLEIDDKKSYTLVSQTTFNMKIFNNIIEKLDQNEYNNISVFNTICDATIKRQEACASLASKSDIMIIIGGRNSSNTKKLFEISKLYCKECYHIENYKDLPYNNINTNYKIGFTAGASTPDWIIEEVTQNVRKLEHYNE